MGFYRKVPVVIEAVQWDGTNDYQVEQFLGSDHGGYEWADGQVFMLVGTLEDESTSWHYSSPGDYIIRGVNGEHYACKPDIFQKTYEEVT